MPGCLSLDNFISCLFVTFMILQDAARRARSCVAALSQSGVFLGPGAAGLVGLGWGVASTSRSF